MGRDQLTEVIAPCLEIAVLVKAGARRRQQDVVSILLLSKFECCIDGFRQVPAANDITGIAGRLDDLVQVLCPGTKEHHRTGLLGQLLQPA